MYSFLLTPLELGHVVSGRHSSKKQPLERFAAKTVASACIIICLFVLQKNREKCGQVKKEQI